MNKSEQVRTVMLDHHLNCAQSLLSVFCEDFGLDRNMGLKVAMGFGSGMARAGKTCGAVTGAYMVLGLSQRINENNPRESIIRTYKLIHDFNREFELLNGSLICSELLKMKLDSPEKLDEARSKGVFSTPCSKLVSDAAKILESMLPTY